MDFEVKSRAAAWYQGSNLFCHECLTPNKFPDEASVLRLFNKKAERTRMQRQPGEPGELPVQAGAAAVAEDVEQRLQRIEGILAELQNELRAYKEQQPVDRQAAGSAQM